jgi:hypothetical protein
LGYRYSEETKIGWTLRDVEDTYGGAVYNLNPFYP